jgi:hypothetical protein
MTEATAALERALVDACLDPRGGEAIAGDLRAFLESRGVRSDDVDAILAAPARMGIYRTLVRNGLSSVVARLMPRTRARMNAARDGSFDADFAKFLHEISPRTHYLRNVPEEFFEWAKPRWDADARLRPYLVDLAAHELACFGVASIEAPAQPEPVAEVDLARPAVLSPSMRLMRYEWAVHELPEDPSALGEPENRKVALAGYRDEEHAVRWIELTPLAAGILERLAAGDPLGAGIARACADHGARADLADIASLLADLGARGILLGGAPL